MSAGEGEIALRPSGRPLGDSTPGLLDVTIEELGARTAEEHPDYVATLRAEGAAWLETRGFPKPNDEAFRFTPLRPVLRVPYRPARPRPSAAPEPGASGDAIVVEGGVPVSGVGARRDGVTVERLRDALGRDDRRLRDVLGQLARVNQGFLAQNGALFTDGLAIVVAKGARPETLRVVYRGARAESPILETPRTVVVLEAGSSAVLVETHEGGPAGGAPRFENAVTEIALGAGARLEHVRLVLGTEGSASVETLAVRQGQGSTYVSRVFTLGGPLSRLDVSVLFDGEGAECKLEGLYVARGGTLVDHHTLIDHAVPRCTSRERYKGILDGNGVAVFDGTVVVRPGASGTEAHQENRNLLLSGDAVAHTKPHLEIDTDDVKCSHGATVGRLDPAQLFYLRSRGIDPAVARALLTRAFAREMVESIDDPDVRAAVEHAVMDGVPGAVAGLEGA